MQTAMKTYLISGLALLALTACGNETPRSEAAPAPQTAMSEAMPMAARSADMAMAAPAPRAQGGTSGEPTAGPMLAYSYDMTLELPAASVANTQAGHAQACRQAGFDTCQIVAASVNNPDSEYPRARLEIRATPTWLAEFRAGLGSEAEAAGGGIIADTTRVDDLTARIVDTAARVEAQTTLRDRLQNLLETRQGNLSDLLAVERELANVQANLDAQASVLAALQQRVDTSRLALNYQAKREIITPGELNPIAEAIKEMGEVFAASVASLILFLAGAIPWLIIAVPVISLVIIGFRRLLRRKKPETQSQTSA